MIISASITGLAEVAWTGMWVWKAADVGAGLVIDDWGMSSVDKTDETAAKPVEGMLV